MNLIRAISGRRTRSDRITRFRVADAIIASRILYGIELTGRASDELLRILEPTFNKTIRIISGLLPSTPAPAACSEMGILLLEFKLALTLCNRAISFLKRTKANRNLGFLPYQANRVLQTLANCRLPPVAALHRVGPRSWLAKNILIDNYIKTKFRRNANPSQVQAHVKERISQKYALADVRFTDGSKRNNSVGAGIFANGISESHKLPNIYSVFSAETAAIFRAISLPSDVPILVVTDSASALQVIESPTNRHPFIQWIHSTMEEQNKDVTFLWVPGHCGIQGNEKADALANLGRQSRLLTPTSPADDVRLWVKNVIWDSWAQRWNRAVHARKIKPTVERWEDLTSRRELVILSRLRTGHTRLSHNMSGRGDFKILCENCNTHNSVEHFIVNCPTLENLRIKHNITCIQTALSPQKTGQTALLDFLKDAKLYDAI